MIKHRCVMRYDDPNARATYMSQKWFKYTFDGISITMSEIGSVSMFRGVTRYYIMRDVDLYLSETYQGEANCYTEFYRDNGLEFRP